MRTDSYINEKKKIFDDYNDKNINFQEKTILLKEFSKKDPINSANIFCKEVVKKFNLPKHFEYDVYRYMLSKNEDDIFLGVKSFFDQGFLPENDRKNSHRFCLFYSSFKRSRL